MFNNAPTKEFNFIYLVTFSISRSRIRMKFYFVYRLIRSFTNSKYTVLIMYVLVFINCIYAINVLIYIPYTYVFDILKNITRMSVVDILMTFNCISLIDSIEKSLLLNWLCSFYNLQKIVITPSLWVGRR